MTTTRSIPARDITAGMTIVLRSRFRVVLTNASLDLDNDGNVWAYAVLEAVTGQPLNMSLPADELVAVVA